MKPDKFIKTALEASIYAAPSDYGLSAAELREIGARHDVREGELRDALTLNGAWEFNYDLQRYVVAHAPTEFHSPPPEDQRNVDAFQFVMEYSREVGREHGEANARFEIESALHIAEGRGLPRHDVEVAFAVYRLSGHLKEIEPGVVQAQRHMFVWALPRRQLADNVPIRHSYPELAELLPTVKDVVSRRSDGRLAHANPVPAFAETLSALGCSRFRPWWTHIAGELARADALLSPVSVIVLSAALLEAALSCLLGHASQTGASMTKGLVNQKTKSWRLPDLITEANAGQDPVLGGDLGRACFALNDHRQRIHVGRFWAEPDPGLQDIRPEEARAARATLDAALRAMLDWLARHPTP